MSVTNAVFKRVMERNDVPCADVEVEVEGLDHKLIVLFAPSEGKDPDIAMILRKDADHDIDWYDNDLHSAYVDVSASLFGGKEGHPALGSREQFKTEVLGFGNVREQVLKSLTEHKVGAASS